MDLNFQYAHNSHEESETTSNVTEAQALDAFKSFEWLEEAKKANEIKKCSPTVALLKGSPDHMIWISSFEKKGKLSFISECRFPGEVSSFFGFSKKLGTVSLHAESFTIKEAEHAFSLFLMNNEEELRNLYKNA